MKRFLKYWLPTIIYMGFIFYLSSQTSAGIGGVKDYYSHFIAYAFLGFLFYRAFLNSNYKKNVIFLSIIFTALYGVSDEIHQYFVPGRNMSIWDMLTNSIGGCFVIIINFIKDVPLINKIFKWLL